MKEELVSIIIPVYNAGQWLERCLRSVLGQSYPVIEVIAVNDGSADNSLEILRRIRKEDRRLILIDQENQGVSAARNKGIDSASGEWICFVDADDYVHPDYIRVMVEAAGREGADAAAVNFFLELPRGLRLPYPFILPARRFDGEKAVRHSFRMLYFPTFLWNKMFRKSHFDDKGLRFPAIMYEDAFIVPMLFLDCKKVVVLKKAYYHYVRQPQSLTHRFGFRHVRDYLTAANMFRHSLAKRGIWDEWEKAYRNWLSMIMIQIVSTLYLSRRTLTGKDRTLLIRQARANVRAMREAPKAEDRPDQLPFDLGPSPDGP